MILRNRSTRFWGIMSLVYLVFSFNVSMAQEAVVIRTLDDFAACSPDQLEMLFAQGNATAIPTGKVRAIPLVNPGKPQARVASRAGRVVFSGKIIADDASQATNVFFGIPMVRGVFRVGPSVRDGRPAIILDYTGTSILYRNARDEIREISPGLFLGYVMDVRDSSSRARRWFAFEPAR
jgi:hypothetical protein